MFPPNSYVEALTCNVMVFRDGAFGVIIIKCWKFLGAREMNGFVLSTPESRERVS